MNFPSLIFWSVFVLPMVVFLVWLIKQDKNKKMGVTGLVILGIMVVVGIVYMYVKTGGR